MSSSPAPSSHTPSNQQGIQGQKPFAVKKKEDENESLAALYAEREGGQDTFGNIGALRFVVCPFSKICSVPTFFFGYIDTDKRTLVEPFWQIKPVQATTRSHSSSSKIMTNLSLISKTTFRRQISRPISICVFFFICIQLFGLLARVFFLSCYHLLSFFSDSLIQLLKHLLIVLVFFLYLLPPCLTFFTLLDSICMLYDKQKTNWAGK